MIVDMHCHLDLYPDPFDVAMECRLRGAYVLSVTTTPQAWDGSSRLAEGNKRIRTALGLHPQLAHKRENELELFDALLPNTKYVGEIGLDGGAGFKKYGNVQVRVFRHILNGVNKSGGRIMSIHSRSSADIVLKELKGVDGVAILHWFTGTPNQLRMAVDIGCWFSVGPAMLNSKRGRGLVSMMPRDRVLPESDGPFAKVAGRALFPWDVCMVTNQLALLWKCETFDASEVIEDNIRRLLGLV